MNVLVVNVGSSSLKFELINTSVEAIASNTEQKLCRGLIDKIGMTTSMVRLELPGSEPEIEAVAIWDHSAAIRHMLRVLRAKADTMQNPPRVEAVGHRVVHGGEFFSKSVLIDDQVAARIRDCIELAPLHNPHNL